MTDFICQYGNCEKLDTPIIVTDKKRIERARFCCAEHAALYLLRYCSLAAYDRVQEQFRRDFP
jgi:hypothetical protein